MLVAGKRVLIVEDNWLLARDYEVMLSDADMIVTGIAASFSEALTACAITRPDMAIMDIHLIGAEDGVTCALELYRRWQVRSLFVTAFNRPRLRERAEGAHALGWVTKPISKDAFLKAAVAALVSATAAGDKGALAQFAATNKH